MEGRVVYPLSLEGNPLTSDVKTRGFQVQELEWVEGADEDDAVVENIIMC